MKIEDIWTKNLIVPSYSIFISDHSHQVIVDDGTFWVEESTTWGKLIDMEKILMLTDCSMITFLGFFLEKNMLSHQFLIWEGNSIHSLKTIITSFT